MNTIILYALGIASLVVLVSGTLFMVVLIIYGIQKIWAKVSACAKNTREYMEHRQDYILYKRDYIYWEESKRAKADRCHRCEYRKKFMEAEERADGENHP